MVYLQAQALLRPLLDCKTGLAGVPETDSNQDAPLVLPPLATTTFPLVFTEATLHILFAPIDIFLLALASTHHILISSTANLIVLPGFPPPRPT